MPNYAYRAVDASGRTVRGEMECANEADLEARLRNGMLELVSARPARRRGTAAGSRRVTRQDLITLFYQTEQLTGSGVPLLDGLRDLRDSLPEGALRRLVADLIERIQAGSQLSVAMAAHPEVFTRAMRSLIEAGEVSGALPLVLRRLTENLKWEDELVAQTRKLLTYPAFALTVVMGVTLFLVIWLVPQLAKLIQTMGQPLPAPTLAMLALADFFTHRWYVPPLVIAGVVVGVRAYAGMGEAQRVNLDRLKLRIPVIGPILERISLVRFTSAFAMMYSAGIPVIDATRVLEASTGNRVISQAIAQARDEILNGRAIADSFQGTGLFPPLVVRMLRVGESTGALDRALENVAYFYNREVQEGVQRVQALIEPTLTLVMGGVLGLIMYSVLGPIFDVISKVR